MKRSIAFMLVLLMFSAFILTGCAEKTAPEPEETESEASSFTGSFLLVLIEEYGTAYRKYTPEEAGIYGMLTLNSDGTGKLTSNLGESEITWTEDDPGRSGTLTTSTGSIHMDLRDDEIIVSGDFITSTYKRVSQ